MKKICVRGVFKEIFEADMYKGLSSTKVPHLPLSYNTAIFSPHDRPLLANYNNTKEWTIHGTCHFQVQIQSNNSLNVLFDFTYFKLIRALGYKHQKATTQIFPPKKS